MVQECINTSVKRYVAPPASPKTFIRLLKSTRDYAMYGTCHMVSIAPADGEMVEQRTTEALAVLRTGKETTEARGKTSSDPSSSKSVRATVPLERIDEAIRKLPKTVEYDVIAHL